MRRHDVHQITQALRRVVALADVDVHAASAGGTALRACVPKLSGNLLEGLYVVICKNRCDQLALFAVRPFNAYVPLNFPHSAEVVVAGPGHVAVFRRRVVGFGAEVLCNYSGGLFPCHAVEFDLNANGLLLHVLNLYSGLFIHDVCLLYVFLRFPFGMCIFALIADNSKENTIINAPNMCRLRCVCCTRLLLFCPVILLKC